MIFKKKVNYMKNIKTLFSFLIISIQMAGGQDLTASLVNVKQLVKDNLA